MQSRQTDAVDQFVAREANGYKAVGFSRQRVNINESQESNLPGTTSVPSISRHEARPAPSRKAHNVQAGPWAVYRRRTRPPPPTVTRTTADAGEIFKLRLLRSPRSLGARELDASCAAGCPTDLVTY